MTGKSSAKRAAKNQKRLIKAQAVKDRARLAEEASDKKRKESLAKGKGVGRASLLATSATGEAVSGRSKNLGGT